jgi:hypothetical protein
MIIALSACSFSLYSLGTPQSSRFTTVFLAYMKPAYHLGLTGYVFLWARAPSTIQRLPTYEESLGISHEYAPAETIAAGLPSRAWYLIPFLFGIIGGLIAYVGTRDRDKDMATKLLLFSLIWSIVLFLIVGWYAWLNPLYHWARALFFNNIILSEIYSIWGLFDKLGIGAIFGALIAVFGIFIAVVGFIYYFQESADKTLSLTMMIFGLILSAMYVFGTRVNRRQSWREPNSMREGSTMS